MEGTQEATVRCFPSGRNFLPGKEGAAQSFQEPPAFREPSPAETQRGIRPSAFGMLANGAHAETVLPQVAILAGAGQRHSPQSPLLPGTGSTPAGFWKTHENRLSTPVTQPDRPVQVLVKIHEFLLKKKKQTASHGHIPSVPASRRAQDKRQEFSDEFEANLCTF